MLIFVLGVIFGFIISSVLYSFDAKNKKSTKTSQANSQSVSSSEHNNNYPNAYKLNKNELAQGSYNIGIDIPVGVYDFIVVYGSGGKFDIAMLDENDKIIQDTWTFYWVGLEKEYENKQLIHIDCKAGYTISITGNVVLRIARSQKIALEL